MAFRAELIPGIRGIAPGGDSGISPHQAMRANNGARRESGVAPLMAFTPGSPPGYRFTPPLRDFPAHAVAAFATIPIPMLDSPRRKPNPPKHVGSHGIAGPESKVATSGDTRDSSSWPCAFALSLRMLYLLI